MSIARPTTPTRAPGGVRGAARVFNRIVLALAGTRLLPLYGVIEHRGRRSGKLFRTPVVVRAAGDGFVVPMPWGEGTDWYRNVRAAGGCQIRWRGREYAVDRPELIADPAQTLAYFGRLQGALMRRFGITQAVRLHPRKSS